MSTACIFPGCQYAHRPDAPTCELHRLVTISSTGSWLERAS